VFRAAPLRNVALRAPCFHSGQVWSLEAAVGVMARPNSGPSFRTRNEDDIVAFLGSLNGQLPNIDYPILPVRADATPRPSLGK